VVFRAWTDPDLVAQWLGPREYQIRLAEYHARPGGGYRYSHLDADGNVYGFHGVLHTVRDNELIVQTFEFDGAPGQVSLESAAFEDLGGRTRLRSRSVYPSVQAREAAIARWMERGIVASMDRLNELTRPGPERRRAGQVVVDISMSLDGYVTAPGADLDHGLGVGGEPLHVWAMGEQSPRDVEILDAAVARTGAVIMGRRTFDFVDGPNGWDETLGYGAERDQTEVAPLFVVTHSVPEKVRLAGRFTFVTDGLVAALDRARAAAGDKDVVIMGGGNLAYGFLRAGLVDVLSIHLAPIVLGGGTPLFPADEAKALRLERIGSVTTPAAEHLTYRVINEPRPETEA
jgi:uncharacterized protein YndB with AHSA1/START domain/dihydrofolate reductase